MIRWVLPVLVILWATVVAAQGIPVRSGEHGSFTRLVMPVPDNAEWSVEPSEDGRRLSIAFETPGVRFDTARAFDRIGRDRIVGMSATGGTLTVDLACPCVSSVFLHDNAFLVIDIREDEAAFANLTRGLAREEPDAISTTVPGIARDLSALRLGVSPGIGPARERVPALPGMDLSERLPDPARAARSDPAADEIGRAIITNIATAATDGLLRPAPGVLRPGSPEGDPDPAGMTAAEPGAPPKPLADILRESLSSFDGRTDGVLSIGGSPCTSADPLMVETWGSQDADMSSISGMRADLFGEFDKPNPDAVLAQAKALMYFGLGAEARAVLALMQTPPPVLLGLSHAIDGDSDPGGRLSGQADCPGPVALWSLVGGGDPVPGTPIDTQSVITAFEALPSHLREHLGPIVARKLHAAARKDAAASILRRLQRLHGEETPAIALVRGEIALKDGDAEAAAQVFLPLARQKGPETAAAVAGAVEAAHETDDTVPRDVAELSGALAREMRGSADGPSLWRANVLSLLNAGRFEDALSAFVDRAGIDTDLADRTGEDLMASLAEKAPDATFLTHVADERLPSLALMPPRIIEPYVRRLLGLGLPDAVLEAIVLVPAEARTRAMQLVQAEALLRMFRPEAAELLLIGLQGDDALSLRAEARAAMGDHDFAQALFSRLGVEDRARESAWLSGNWEQVVGSDDAMSRAAQLASEKDGGPETDDISLAYAEALTAGSADARATLRALLDETRLVEE
ncbi:hypothetical protein [Thetidibacter halocola]|uniref:Uncharacterized protein n=1 Tax=Thetidibacter halocola TaxID=2827239 RepID=A0A8J8B7F1_9RHOB|nr:hypothetical protein [Thetidibacter halocola]MBS0123649.1 hypothetical protein [Thetidibacter halocola]